MNCNATIRLFVLLSSTVLAASFSQAAPMTAKARQFEIVHPSVLRATRVSGPRALKQANPEAVGRALTAELDRLVEPTTLMIVRIPRGSRRITLKLREYEPDLGDIEVMKVLADGSVDSQPVRRNDTRFFIGHVKGEEQSRALLFQTHAHGWGGQIEMESGTLMMEPQGWSEAGASGSWLFRQDDTEEYHATTGCGAPAAAQAAPEAPRLTATTQPALAPRHNVPSLAIVRYDVRYVAAQDYLLARGGDDNVVANEMWGMHFGVSNTMQYQVNGWGVALHRDKAVIMTSPLPSAWFPVAGQTDGNVLLENLAACKRSLSCLNGVFVGTNNVSVLLVARALRKSPPDADAIGGIAYIGGLCTNSSAAVVEVSSARFARLAHELGHIFGACHDGPRGCNSCSTGLIMSPTVGETTPAAYSSCSLSAMSARVANTPGCRAPIFCGDTDADAKSLSSTLCPGGMQRITATDAAVALKLSVGHASPLYSHLADVAPPIGLLTTTDATTLLNYAVCNYNTAAPPSCGL